MVARRERGHLEGERDLFAGGHFLLGQFHPVAGETADHGFHGQLLGEREGAGRDLGRLAAVRDLRATRV